MHRVTLRAEARRELRRLARADRTLGGRLDEAILGLAKEPRPSGCGKLAGGGELYRIRVGDYRIIYTVNDTAGLVYIQRVAHRGDVYR